MHVVEVARARDACAGADEIRGVVFAGARKRRTVVWVVRLDLQRVRDAVASIDPAFMNTPQFESVPLSDALGCSVTLKVETLNPVRSFKDLLEIVHDVVLVDDDSIKAGMRYLFELGGLVAEPSAALGLAAILENRERFRGLTVATIVCGSNISPDDFRRWALDPHR